MQVGTTVTMKFHVLRAEDGRKKMARGAEPQRDTPEGRVPRISRLMALALKFERMLAEKSIADQTELAEIGHVTRARVTQIMNLLHLAPDIQEAILHLPRVTAGRDPLTERELRAVTAETDWRKQRAMWKKIGSGRSGRRMRKNCEADDVN